MAHKRSDRILSKPTSLTALSLSPSEQDRLARILDDYLIAAEQGAPISPDELLKRHPNDANHLRAYVSGLQLFHAATAEKPLPYKPSGPLPASGAAWEMTREFELLNQRLGDRLSFNRTYASATLKSAKASHQRLDIAKAKQQKSEDPTTALRHSRLRAAAFCCTVWWTTIAVTPIDHRWALLPTIVAACLAAAFGFLTLKASISPGMLKSVEVAIFGLMAGTFASTQYRFMVDGAIHNDAVALALVGKNADIASMTLLFPYAMLIPNSWKSAFGMILLLAFYPAIVTGLFLWSHPEAWNLTGTLFQEEGLNVLKMLIAAGLSLYGVHVLDTLRHEMFEARRLNQYQLGECIGSGGMGDVYLAEHRMLKRPCAIKLIRSEVAGDRKTLARFEREVRSTARLSHPNIVEVFDYGHTDDHTFYYVMEYLRGVALAELVTQYGPQPAGRVIYLLSQACQGLAEAHASGLIHRDLKPANIFAAQIGKRYDVVKLLDFGLVRSMKHDAPSGRGEITGTPMYMAPEQAMAMETIDQRADLYALGAVAYHLVTGRPPFESDSPLGVMLAHANQPIVPPTQLQADIPDDLERVIIRCLAKEPSERFNNADELRAALAACAAAGDWDNDRAEHWWRNLPPNSSDV